MTSAIFGLEKLLEMICEAREMMREEVVMAPHRVRKLNLTNWKTAPEHCWLGVTMTSGACYQDVRGGVHP